MFENPIETWRRSQAARSQDGFRGRRLQTLGRDEWGKSDHGSLQNLGSGEGEDESLLHTLGFRFRFGSTLIFFGFLILHEAIKTVTALFICL